ncbi:MAG: hypothetical protein PWQ99_885 [Clostridia bacterium]|jgi:trimethylamine--corrinoid protein Co-methyltransferase|nr:hypothetical protein [Clostridia bacterium]MDN5375850.1 hypothetical protein [Thermacetogenium sp.]
MIYGMGLLEGGLTWDYAMVVMENEMARMIMHCVRGIPVNDEKIAFEVLSEVGPGGEYISHPHTFKHFKELSHAELLDRRSREAWSADGGKDLVERSYEKALEILNSFKPKPLSEDVQRELKRILAEAEEETREIKERERRSKAK